MRELRGTEVVAEDLRRLYHDLNGSRRYPVKFRYAFEQYIYKSQQLTETMRKEFKFLTGDSWAANKYPGWNAYTEILKALRNATYHGYPLALHGCALAIYEGEEFATDLKPLDELDLVRGYRVMASTFLIEMPFDEEVVPMSAGYPLKYPLGAKTHSYPIKEFVSYELTWCLLEAGVRSATKKAGTVDSVKIVLHSYPALKGYIEYYERTLDEFGIQS
ncbi:hypothetical protein [Marinobacterium lacunae]|uniref:hypothetical protein n=1 Tax=Marinobacterium lacunae TaxID=1232683 RepID=UPI00056317F8|nr:hypothetical protein [Marinobacterium lacunae]